MRMLLGLALGAVLAVGQRQMETLGRGLVAVPLGEGRVFVSWRLLAGDAQETGFHVYRHTGDGDPVRLNSEPVLGATHWTDQADPAEAHSYFVQPVVDGAEGPVSKPFLLPANAPVRPYLSVPLQTPEGYTPNDASVGDLDGDGEYEIVLHQTGASRDNSQSGRTDPPILEAYRLDGTLLWRINLGRNIREGAHYTQFIVYDLDGDGRAEVACKTADGTVDGIGRLIGRADADFRNEAGYILDGPEYLTIFDGLTGAALANTEYVPPRGSVASWGDNYGNRVDRFLAAVAYVDGKRPSLIMARGYYTRAVVVAWNWRDGQLSRVWTFDSDDGNPANRAWRGEGNHNLSVADVDGDGRDEIVYGAAAIDDDGKGLYATGLGHGDAMHLSDLDPERPGLEVYRIQERFSDAGAHMFDARTGEILWRRPSVTGSEGPGRGLALDIDPRHPGFESWAAGAGVTGLYNAKGERIGDRVPSSCNFGVYWDGDFLRELLDRTVITKWNWETARDVTLLNAEGAASNNGTKPTPALSADILGDWREEVIWRSADNRELRIYTTTIPTAHRMPTLMHDSVYRLGVAWQNVAYNQPPHLGSALPGDGR